MRLCFVRFAALVPLCVLLALPAYGDQTFPYTAWITDDDVYVRSGPGESYYPTSKLHTGDKVEVYRHDPGGWYAIRPVEGSLAWISGRYLEVGEDGLGTITGDRVAARVGSEFSDIRDVIQVRLHRGEAVELLGKKEFGSQPGAGTWYKIAPPSGEFRWVNGRFVDPDYHHSGVRKAPAGSSPLVEPAQSSADPIATAVESDARDQPEATAATTEESTAGHGPAEERVAGGWSASGAASERSPGQGPTDRTASGITESDPVESQAPATQADAPVEPAGDPSETDTLRRLSPEEFRAELDEMDMELSIMLAEEPTVWKFDDLVIRAQALLTEAETAVERGRVRLLANKIAQSDDIKRRHDAVNGTRTATERHNRQLAELGRIEENAEPEAAPASRFDGEGRLARVVPAKLGVPRYALVDEKGEVRSYVTAAPGVNMNYYLGRTIGVNGIRSYIADKRAQHVAAKHVTLLDDGRLR